MKNIHLIPTDKPSRLIHNDANQLCYQSNKSFKNDRKTRKKFNIYITSNEEIKEGDKDFYIIANDRDKTWINRIEKVVECKIDTEQGKVLILSLGTFLWVDEGKKIILTTDQDLIKDGVQPIDDEFLEWFVKNPSCEEVEIIITNEVTVLVHDHKPYYKIIIQKQKTNLDLSGVHKNHCFQGEYEDSCKYGYDDCPMTPKEPKQDRTCTNNCSDVCGECQILVAKQEILEECAKAFAKTQVVRGRNIAEWDDKVEEIIARNFIEGAKWQQERMYSEEEVKPLLSFIKEIKDNWDCDKDAHKYNTICRRCDAEKTLEQFKKKL